MNVKPCPVPGLFEILLPRYPSSNIFPRSSRAICGPVWTFALYEDSRSYLLQEGGYNADFGL